MNWWNWLPDSVKRWHLWRISWLVEFLSGSVATVAGILSTQALALLPPRTSIHSPGAYVITFGAATFWSGVYEAFMDPNGWEWDDFLQRLVGIIFWVAAWVFVSFLMHW